MNLYLISQAINNDYDTYSDAIVAAETEELAKLIHPGGSIKLPQPPDHPNPREYRDWVSDPKDVAAKLVGTAIEGVDVGVLCASFHAG